MDPRTCLNVTESQCGRDLKATNFRHLLKGRSLKGRCNVRVYVPVCSCVCVCPSSPPLHRPYCGTEQQNPHTPTWLLTPFPPHDPSPPFPHPYLQAIAWPVPGKNYPTRSARKLCIQYIFLEGASFFWSLLGQFNEPHSTSSKPGNGLP